MKTQSKMAKIRTKWNDLSKVKKTSVVAATVFAFSLLQNSIESKKTANDTVEVSYNSKENIESDSFKVKESKMMKDGMYKINNEVESDLELNSEIIKIE